MSERYDAVVIGGGPAGMMAAITAAEAGAKILLLDKNDLPGKKLRITGKGRCNICNNCDERTFLSNIRRGDKFLFSSIYGFSNADIMTFFEGRGLSLVTERGSRVFPKSQDANDVADLLIREMKRAGVAVKRGAVQTVEMKDGAVSAVLLNDGGHIGTTAALVATGGLSYPKTGSDGDGYHIAETLGHTVAAPAGSLVPIECGGDIAEMQGLSLKNVDLVARRGKRVLFSERGEMLFTHFGISGPLALTMSSHLVGEDLPEIDCYIDLKPALDFDTLDKRLLRDFSENQNRDFKNSLGALLPKAMIPVIVRRSGISPEKKVNGVTAAERRALGEAIKRFAVPMLRFRPVAEAIVTAGGVNLDEVDPKTMMSKRVKNLFFAGEVLDADGYTGGFNLGIAFSTGHAAGVGIAAAARVS